MSGYSPILELGDAPMPETMSPREKGLGQIAYEGWAQGLPGCEWDNQTATQKRAWSKASDAILAALASSGDHAELAGECVRGLQSIEDRICASDPYRFTDGTIYAKSIRAIETLLAENAALRGERDRAKERMHKAIDKAREEEIAAQSAELRATEAERKLAEAVGVVEWYGENARLARLIHSEGDAGRNALADDGGKRARAFLSKEAERG